MTAVSPKTAGGRIEAVQTFADGVLRAMPDEYERRCAYVHLYGVAQGCALLAEKRGEDVELAIVAGLLHDLWGYANATHEDHARRGGAYAREILTSLALFSGEEIEKVAHAISVHSDKGEIGAPFDEILKDADVLQHRLYNPFTPVPENERARYAALRRELF